MNPILVDELAAAWSFEDPNPALHVELEELLRRDPVARKRFLDYCVGEMALVDSLACATATPVSAASASAAQPLRLHPRSRSNRRTARSNRLWAGWPVCRSAGPRTHSAAGSVFCPLRSNSAHHIRQANAGAGSPRSR